MGKFLPSPFHRSHSTSTSRHHPTPLYHIRTRTNSSGLIKVAEIWNIHSFRPTCGGLDICPSPPRGAPPLDTHTRTAPVLHPSISSFAGNIRAQFLLGRISLKSKVVILEFELINISLTGPVLRLTIESYDEAYNIQSLYRGTFGSSRGVRRISKHWTALIGESTIERNGHSNEEPSVTCEARECLEKTKLDPATAHTRSHAPRKKAGLASQPPHAYEVSRAVPCIDRLRCVESQITALNASALSPHPTHQMINALCSKHGTTLYQNNLCARLPDFSCSPDAAASTTHKQNVRLFLQRSGRAVTWRSCTSTTIKRYEGRVIFPR